MPVAHVNENVLVERNTLDERVLVATLHAGIDLYPLYTALNDELIHVCTRNRRNALGIQQTVAAVLLPDISGRLFVSPGRECWHRFLEYAQRPVASGMLKENCFLRDCIEQSLRAAAEYCFGRDEWPRVAKAVCAEYGWDYTNPFVAFVSERRSGKTIWAVCVILALCMARPGTTVAWTAAFFPACEQAKELIERIGEDLYGIKFTRRNKKKLAFFSPHGNIESKILFFADNQQYVFFFFYSLSFFLSRSLWTYAYNCEASIIFPVPTLLIMCFFTVLFLRISCIDDDDDDTSTIKKAGLHAIFSHLLFCYFFLLLFLVVFYSVI